MSLKEMYLHPANLHYSYALSKAIVYKYHKRCCEIFLRDERSRRFFSRSKAVKCIRNVDNFCHQVLPLELTKNFEEEKQVFFAFSLSLFHLLIWNSFDKEIVALHFSLIYF